MKKLKNVFVGILALTIGIFTQVSCMKTDPVPLQAIVDVIIQDVKTDAGVKYGIVVYATANYEIKSAKVTGPGTGGKVYQLVATSNKQQFVLIPLAADYSDVLPAKGDYSFEITSTSDEIVIGKDAVGDEKLAPIVIKTTALTNHSLKTTWDKITGAEAYVLNLYSADRSEILFSSNYIDSDDVSFEFGATTSGWANGKSPIANTNYLVELLALKAETNVTSDKGNNLQFITVDSKIIKWE